MKKLNLFFWGIALCAGLSMTACSSSDDSTSSNGGNNGGNDGPAPTTFTYATLSGVVKDIYGKPLAGVKVANSTMNATTDANGVFTFDQVADKGGRIVLKFTKDGYFDIVKAMPKVDKDGWTVTMINDNGSDLSKKTTFNAGVEEKITITSYKSSTPKEMKVELPDAYVDENGNNYTGVVEAKAVYLDPDDSEFATKMPGGDLAAVRTDGSDAQLISYGMTAVELTDENGKELQLAEGKKAKLTFPIPDSQMDFTPDEIPLWSFNEETGLWEEEGVAKKEGNYYVGEVSHFSWHNLDYPQTRASLVVNVKDENGKKLPNIWVDVDGQVTKRTNEDGSFSCYIPSDTKLYVKVKSSEYANYSPEVVKNVGPVSAGTTTTVDLVMPVTSAITGTITNEGSGSKVCSIELNLVGFPSLKVVSDIFGHYIMRVPTSYKGVASIIATGADGTENYRNIELDGTDKVFNITINASSAKSSPGWLKLTDAKGETATFELLPAASGMDSENGLTLVDNDLSLSYYVNKSNDTYQSLSLEIDEYSESTSTYANKNLYFSYRNGLNDNLNISISEANIKVEKSGNNYTFSFTGAKARYYGTSTDNYYKNGTIDMKVTIPISLIAKAYYDVDASTVQGMLPSYIPYISGKKLNALVVTMAPTMSKGGVVCYTDTTITEDQYKALLTEAEGKFGKAITPSGVDEDEYAHHQDHFGKFFFKNNNLLNIAYNSWYKDQLQYNKDYKFKFDKYMLYGEGNSALITIRAFEDLKVPVTDFIRY